MHKKFFESVKGNVFFKIEIWLKQKSLRLGRLI